MFGWLTKRFKQTAIQPRGPRLQRQSYDAAALTPEALRDWANVDDLAADAAASPSIRTIIRKRGRHELLNNPYMDGIIQTLAGDVVGKTPRLRMRTAARSANSLIEREFAVWMKAIRLPSKLRLAVETVAAQGEIFGLLFSNPRLPTLIKLDVRFYEPDQIATPDIWLAADRDRVDGIEFDRAGNPRFYHVLREHPGDTRWLPIGMKLYDRVPAEWMVHLFKIRRPGQHRGVPRIMSSLPLFPQRRSFRQSVLTAARVAAQLGAVLLENEQDPNSADPLDAGVAV
ncbi:MAG TPA: phage portal protein, partial [Candidatus Binatia bacterium]|nr:phage portal protein [Candidatus Binatia bacterium]